MTVFHDSQNPVYRSPAGAQPCGTRVRLFLKTDAKAAQVRFWIDGREMLLPMEVAEGGFSRVFDLPEKPCVVWYYFRVDDDLYYGNAPDNLGGEGALYGHEPPSYQITVYDPAWKTPDWMGDGIMMQIMVDRFYRGKNTPVRGRFHENWNEEPYLDIQNNGDNAADDFFGGNLDGIRRKLPYLKDLGVTVLYLNPVFLSPSNHKYDTSDYMKIDPSFGTLTDLKRLCAEAKSMGIRVMLDGVFSHTGADSVYFNREKRFPGAGAYHSKRSKYFNWYRFENWPEKYACWWGFDTLPNVDKSSGSFRDYIIRDGDSVCAHYLRAGISGWRLDVADELPMDFIAEFRARMKRENPDAALLGEVWEDPTRKVAYGKLRSYCLGDTLDSAMNYPLRDAILRFLLGRITAHACAREIRSLLENMPFQFARSCMNLLGSHDKPRALAVLADVGDMEPERQYRHPLTLTGEEYARGRRRLIAAWNLICALPGMPCVYYGDEAGLYAMADPYCRGTYPWGREDEELQTAFREAIARRRKYAALTKGKTEIFAAGDGVLRVVRALNGQKIVLTVDRNAENATWDELS